MTHNVQLHVGELAALDYRAFAAPGEKTQIVSKMWDVWSPIWRTDATPVKRKPRGKLYTDPDSNLNELNGSSLGIPYALGGFLSRFASLDVIFLFSRLITRGGVEIVRRKTRGKISPACSNTVWFPFARKVLPRSTMRFHRARGRGCCDSFAIIVRSILSCVTISLRFPAPLPWHRHVSCRARIRIRNAEYGHDWREQCFVLLIDLKI